MNKSMKFWLLTLIAILSLSIIVACGDSTDKEKDGNKNNNNSEENGNKNANNDSGTGSDAEEITIRWAHQWGEDHFWNGIGKDLEEKFPHITIEVQDAGTDHPEDLEDLIAAKKSPDIVTLGLVTHIPFLDDLDLAYDMTELVENSGFDLDRLEPSILEYARKQDPNNDGSGENENGLYAIPSSRPTWSLHYNKDVFDKLGVEYPQDGMTWNETIELAKDLTREVDGVQYRGLDLDVPYDQFTQLDAVSVDPDSGEVLVAQSQEWKDYVTMIDDVVSIPGNYPGDNPAELFHRWGELFDEGNVAMATAATNYGWLENDNVDIATFPLWDGYDELMPVPNAGAYSITEPAEHKEEIFKIIEYLLSDEYQTEVSKEGGASVLVSDEVNDVFAENKPEFSDKNLESLFMYPYATGPDRSYKYGVPGLWTLPIDFVESGKDVNDFLREFQEQGEEYVREQEAKE